MQAYFANRKAATPPVGMTASLTPEDPDCINGEKKNPTAKNPARPGRLRSSRAAAGTILKKEPFFVKFRRVRTSAFGRGCPDDDACFDSASRQLTSAWRESRRREVGSR